MDLLRSFAKPHLRDGVLITAFAGWNDASQVATTAAQFLVRRWGATKCAEIEPDPFYVFTETRPQVRMVGKLRREIVWPGNDFFYYENPELDHDFMICIGSEPNLRWKEYCTLVLDYAKHCGVTTVLCLGGLIAEVIHSDPAIVTGSSADPELAQQLARRNLFGSRYEGPTGIVGALGNACRDFGLKTISLWGSVPYYVSPSNPKVTAALIRHVDDIFNLNLDLTELNRAVVEFDAQVDAAVAKNPEVAEYIRKLQSLRRRTTPRGEGRPAESGSADDPPGSGGEELPDAQSLVQELEDFLRRRSSGDDPDSPRETD